MAKKPIDLLMDTVEWKALNVVSHTTRPYATHEGILTIGSAKLKVYQLNTGQRVFDGESMVDFFEGIVIKEKANGSNNQP